MKYLNLKDYLIKMLERELTINKAYHTIKEIDNIKQEIKKLKKLIKN